MTCVVRLLLTSCLGMPLSASVFWSAIILATVSGPAPDAASAFCSTADVRRTSAVRDPSAIADSSAEVRASLNA